jgi:hypothetical protein
VKAARTELVQMEDLTDVELDALQKEFQIHRDKAVTNLERIAASRLRRRSDSPATEPQPPVTAP